MVANPVDVVLFDLGGVLIVKPDRQMFDRVSELLPAPPHRVLFLDDNTLNVDGAVAAGFRAVRVTGVDEARDALIDSGVVTAGE